MTVVKSADEQTAQGDTFKQMIHKVCQFTPYAFDTEDRQTLHGTTQTFWHKDPQRPHTIGYSTGLKTSQSTLESL